MGIPSEQTRLRQPTPPAPSARSLQFEQEVRALRPDFVLIGGELRFASSETFRLSAARISELVGAVKPFAGHVAVIGDPPAQGDVQPIDCLLARGATLEGCTWTLTSDQISAYQAAERAAIDGGAAFLDTMGWFCFERQCPMVVGETVTMRENDHISRSYAIELSGLFHDAFLRALSDGIPAIDGLDGSASTVSTATLGREGG